MRPMMVGLSSGQALIGQALIGQALIGQALIGQALFGQAFCLWSGLFSEDPLPYQ